MDVLLRAKVVDRVDDVIGRPAVRLVGDARNSRYQGTALCKASRRGGTPDGEPERAPRGLASGEIEVLDLSHPLSERTPMIDLPEPLESAPGFSLHAICHYDERGPSHYWNSLRGSEHMGTHLDAPVHWITGRDGIALSGVDSLTPSERRVAEMAAKGHTNREVAQALFVTPKTVEVHLSSVYLKLGICSRSQLATALAEPGRRP